MNHYTDLDPYVIRARNEQIRKEVRSLRLEGRLRKNRSLCGSPLSAQVERGGLRYLIDRTRWGAIASIMLAIVAALSALALVAPSSQAAGDKPDLVVPSGHMTSRTFAFSGESNEFSFTDTTKNAGKGTASSSKSVLAFKRRLADPDRLGGPSRDVPRLGPGDADNGSGSANKKPTRDQIGGGYRVVVCADSTGTVAESNEDNNCKDTGQRLSIIPRHWTGTIKGNVPVTPGVTETWTAQVNFVFRSFSGGFFNYAVRYGNVNYNISGTDSNGCTYSGGRNFELPSGTAQLRLGYGFDTYEGLARVDDWDSYTLTAHCPGGDATILGPVSSTWFDTDEPGPNLVRHFGVTSLHGSYDIFSPTGENEVHYDWDLKAE